MKTVSNMNGNHGISISCAFAAWLAVCAVVGDVPAAGERYAKTGAAAVSRIASDIYDALDAKPRQALQSATVVVKTDAIPYLTQAAAEAGKASGTVVVSSGFLELVNKLAHAKAIDKLTKGYLEKYVTGLGNEPKDLLEASNPRYWEASVMDEQASNFSQMVGTLLALEYSHHYLGHYEKYAGRLSGNGGQPTPINPLLTPDEWSASVRAGVRNCLGAGLGIEGVKALVEAMDKLPKRPAWAAFCVPDSIKGKALRKEMEKIERKFFGGEE